MKKKYYSYFVRRAFVEKQHLGKGGEEGREFSKVYFEDENRQAVGALKRASSNHINAAEDAKGNLMFYDELAIGKKTISFSYKKVGKTIVLLYPKKWRLFYDPITLHITEKELREIMKKRWKGRIEVS